MGASVSASTNVLPTYEMSSVSTVPLADFRPEVAERSFSGGTEADDVEKILNGRPPFWASGLDTSTGIKAEIPYIVGIRRHRDDILFCGGSIINALWILTAAHCVHSFKKNPEWIGITTGGVNGSTEWKQGREVIEIKIHQNYEHSFTPAGYDLALLKLNESLQFNDYVRNIPLPVGNQEWKGFAQVSGWGKLQEDDDEGSDQLMTIILPIVSNAKCSIAYSKNITSALLCAGGEGGRDSCQGDSGGPLACNNNTILCGIVSYGRGCGREGFPGIYTEVSLYTNWISYYLYGKEKCGSEYFYCVEDHRCISRELICNRKKDCSGGSDEETCVFYAEDDRQYSYICNDGGITNLIEFCDEVKECIDHSDEGKCDFRGKNGNCDEGHFTCNSDGRCINGLWRGDGVVDCDDGSDEDYEPMPKNLTELVKRCAETDPEYFTKGWSIDVNHDYFLCNPTGKNLTCVLNANICGDFNDCPDGEDEEGCTTKLWDKTKLKFHCRNGEFIPKGKRCDGKEDCGDKSDEINCYKLDSTEHSFSIKLPIKVNYIAYQNNTVSVHLQKNTTDPSLDASDNLTKFPYIVGIRRKRDDRLFCSGSIVDPRWILTTAKCVHPYKTNPEWIRITAGSVFRESGVAANEQKREVEEIHIYPDYVHAFGNDAIALLKLKEALIFNDCVKNIPLPENGIEQWKGSAELTGWEKLRGDGTTKESAQLKTLTLPIISNDECSEVYDEYNISSKMLCAGGGESSLTDYCEKGGYWGPLTCKANTVLCGILYFGEDCYENPGVYFKLSKYKEWIDYITQNWRLSKCGSEYFYCWEDHKCIDRRFVCDRKKDCSGGSDEETCIKYPIESERNIAFTCNTGEVVEHSYFCDGGKDCADNSDDGKCDFRGKNGTCDGDQFSCISDGRCISGFWRKDGVVDCDDGSDEDYEPMPKNLTDIVKGCAVTYPQYFTKERSILFNHDYFLCNATSLRLDCIPHYYVCDSIKHCSNGEDEEGCATTGERSFDRSKFHCRNGDYVPISKRCDGREDCGDKSDEINCYKLESYEQSFSTKLMMNANYIASQNVTVSGRKVHLPKNTTDPISDTSDNLAQFAYIAGIRRKRDDRLFCSGSIVDPRWIVTTAKCVHPYKTNPEWIRITAGSVFREAGVSANEQKREVEEIHIYPDYVHAFGNDAIALLKLKEALIFNDYVKNISLPDYKLARLKGTAQLSGWEKLQGNVTLRESVQLKTLTLPIISNDECSDVYDEYNISSTTLCVGGRERSWTDYCEKGGNWGPLTCNNNTVLCGILHCGEYYDKYAGVYLELSSYKKWIDYYTGNWRITKCGSDYFYCWEDHKCIDRRLICDRKKDCSRGSDEETCIEYPKESERSNAFICSNGEIVKKYYYFCNGYNDCTDHSDEGKSDFRGKNGTCDDAQFTCSSDGRCINGAWRKDGVVDCDDGSDEDYDPMPKNLTELVKRCMETDPDIFRNEGSIYVNHDYFLCNSTSLPLKCIANLNVCDGSRGQGDCPNGEEEKGCTTTCYEESQFHCRNGEHVHSSNRCDGKEDCGDKSDEINCYKLDSYEHSFSTKLMIKSR